ncbi:ISAzo13 family transposase [Desulfobulbus alkaliphilus]|uniref:ISAzo13 family transposase n=1 Tax=Desulfobulbus alkaliphilus TaxID=869814 RepID=UPI001963E67F|nr:ISAzo13 family transposase [Desulfobulbus alkaliphilus]MBM9538426.1 ISAzo13 family transposase [Desulfobulbus alkaliphilus]
MGHELIAKRFMLISPLLDERQRRLYVAAEAMAIGRGGITMVSQACGVSRPTITAGCKELAGLGADPGADISKDGNRIRKAGGGRKRTVDLDPALRDDLERLIEPVTRGDPESPLRWTAKSVRNLAEELQNLGHATSHRMVAELLHEMGYSLQSNRKVLEGASHPDRNAQFEFIYSTTKEFQDAGQPVISVDTKKKELVGDFKNNGQELRPKGDPEKVRTYDFMIPELGKVAPYGVYDQTRNEGWVNVGTDSDTSAFAVESIRRWWLTMGKEAYPQAERLLITADSGGSNGARVRLWKTELQRFANETGLAVTVRHFPPGTSKWNKIEHRLFSFISQNWQGKPLVSHEVIVNLIAATTTSKGLTVRCELDTNKYPKGIIITDKEFRQVRLVRDEFHGEWNYTIQPCAA